MMKRIFRYFILSILLPTAMRAQTVIDISTGVSNITGATLPVGAMDDTWQIAYSHIIGTPYNPLYVGNGLQSGFNIASPPGAGPQAHAMWIAPVLDASGNHMAGPTYGQHYYKMSFYLWSCPVQGAVMNLKLVGAHMAIYTLYFNQVVNGWNTPSYPLYTNPLQPNVFSTNISIPIAASDVHQGLNEVVFLVVNGGGYHGLEIDGDITIQTATSANFMLRDQYGAETTEFCINEDILLQGTGNFPNTAQVSLLSDNGNGFIVLDTKSAAGLQNGFNVAEIFSTVFQNASTNVLYKLKLSIPGCCSFDISDPFKLVCCDNSVTMKLLNNNGFLTGSSAVKGNFKWTVYSFPAGNSGEYTKVRTFTGSSFQLESTSPCYYVTLESQNTCGNLCVAQSICNSGCDLEPCILAQPQNVRFENGSTGTGVSWSTVTGADHYVIEVIFNDPYCCDKGGGVMAAPKSYYYTSASTSAGIDLPPRPQGFPGYPPPDYCYALRVYAVCADGSRSEASTPICVH